jgi:hypothetical protein
MFAPGVPRFCRRRNSAFLLSMLLFMFGYLVFSRLCRRNASSTGVSFLMLAKAVPVAVMGISPTLKSWRAALTGRRHLLGIYRPKVNKTAKTMEACLFGLTNYVTAGM